jgi:hypothetical protein
MKDNQLEKIYSNNYETGDGNQDRGSDKFHLEASLKRIPV